MLDQLAIQVYQRVMQQTAHVQVDAGLTLAQTRVASEEEAGFGQWCIPPWGLQLTPVRPPAISST
jgi:hypothetical protein